MPCIDQATGNKFFSLKNFNLDSSKALLKVNAERLSLARPGFLSPRSPGVMKIMFSNLNFEHNNLSKDNSVGFSNVNYQVDTHSSHSDHYIADVNFGLAINHIKTPEKLLSMIKDYLLHHSKGTYTRSEILNQITNHMISKQSQIRLSNMKVRYHYDNGHISLYQNPDAIDLTLNGNLLIDWPNLSKGYRFPDLVAATQTHMNLNAPMIQLKHRGKQFTAKNITIGNNDGMSQGSKYESHFSAGPLEFTPNHAIHSSLASGIKIKNISASGTGTVAVKAQHKTEDALLRFAISGLCIKDKDCFDGTLSMNFNNLQLNDDATENQIKGLAGILIYRNNPQQLAKFIHSLAKNNDSFLAKDTNLHINFSLSNKAGKAIHDTVTLSYPNGSLEQPQAHGTMDINNRIFSAFPQISLSLKKVLANLSTHHCVTTQDQENYHTVISPNESDNTIRLNDQPLVTCFKPNSHAPEFAKASTPRVSPQLGRPSHPL